MREVSSIVVTGEDVEAILENPEKVTIVAQPIVDLQRAVIVGYELLSRFDIGKRTTPDRVFAAAIASGHGAKLEALVVDRALDVAMDKPSNCFATINLDPLHLDSPLVSDVVKSHGTLRGVVFEMTEHHPFDDLPSTCRALDALRGRGAMIALDDAGAGYSGLKQLLELKPEIVKLDRDLVTNLHQQEAKRVLVQMLGELAARLDGWVLAEGVETAEEADALVKLGVPLGQGWYFGKPEEPWTNLDVGAQRFLVAAGIAKTFTERCETLDRLVEPCLVIGADDPWPPTARITLRVDETCRPIAMQVLGETSSIVRPAHQLLRVKRTAPVGEVAKRLLTRNEKLRWDPLICIDDRGNFEGIVPVERLFSALADNSLPRRDSLVPSMVPKAKPSEWPTRH